jgi:hypothetical protein
MGGTALLVLLGAWVVSWLLEPMDRLHAMATACAGGVRGEGFPRGLLAVRPAPVCWRGRG